MSRFVTIMLLLAVCGAAGCSDSFKTKEELLKAGVEMMEAGNPNGAVIHFKNALDKDQNYFDARLKLGRAYRLAGKVEAAEKELQKASRQNPSSQEVRIELSQVYLAQNRPDEALAELKQIAGAADNAEALELTGWAYFLKEDASAAVQELQASIAKNPGGTSAPLRLARVYIAMKKPDDAKAQVANVLAANPSHRGAILALADLQIGAGDRDAAIKTFDKLSGVNAADPEPPFRKGMLLLDTGNIPGALGVADELLKKFPKNSAGNRLKGIALYHKQDYNAAIVELQKAMSIQPNMGTVYYLGLSLFARQDFAQAMTYFQKALEADPDFSQARLMVALIHMKDKRNEDAIAEIRKVISKDEKNAAAYSLLGSIYMSDGRFQEGMAAMNRALALDPGLVDVHVKKGVFELARGRSSEAEAEFGAAVRVKPELVQTRALLATYYLKNRDFGKAVKTLTDGLKGQKSDAVLYNVLAEVMLSQNKPAEAVQYLQKAKAADPDHDVAYFRLATISFFQGDRGKAMIEMRSLLDRSPQNLNALLLIGSICESAADKAEAEKFFQRAKETGQVTGAIELAQFHMRQKDSRSALRVLDEAAVRNPNDISLLESKGAVLVAEKKFDDALGVYEKIEKLDPKKGRTYVLRTFVAMKKPQKALDRINQDLRGKPDDLSLLADAAMLHRLLGSADRAIDTAKLMIQRKPADPAGYIILADIYREAKQLDKAIETLQTSGAKADPGLLTVRGTLFAMNKDYKAALASYAAAESAKADFVPAVYQRAALYHMMGNRKEAAAGYERTIRLAPEHVLALNNLAYLHAEDGRQLDMAHQLAAKAFILQPRNGLVLDTLGYVLMKKNKWAESLKVLNKALEFAPDNPTILYHAALACRQQGDKPRAVAHLRSALNAGEFPEKSEAALLLAKLEKEGRS